MALEKEEPMNVEIELAREAAAELAEAIRGGDEASIVYWQVRLAAMERGRRSPRQDFHRVRA